MTSIAAHERTLLCALAQQLGPDAPTLCGDWTVKDLVVHLLMRERSPAAVGIVVRPLAGLLDRATERKSRQDFHDLVKELRHGPPFYSPFALPKIGPALNTLEFFVHHEDVRRAQPDWAPRSLPRKAEDGIWRAIRTGAKVPLNQAPVGVAAQRTDTGERAVLRAGDPVVTLRGLPSEITLYVYGRKEHAKVELLGDEAAVARLREAGLGV